MDRFQLKKTTYALKQTSLDLMTRHDFDSDMERRYQEALKEDGMSAKEYFGWLDCNIRNRG